jgi:uncharacterized integral membrane protein
MSVDPGTASRDPHPHTGDGAGSDPVAPDAAAPDVAGPAEPGELLARVEKLSRRNSFRIGLTVGTVVTVAVGLLIIQNGHTVRLHWLWASFDAPLWIFLALTLAAGMVLARVVPFAIRRARQRARERRDSLRQAREALDHAS